MTITWLKEYIYDELESVETYTKMAMKCKDKGKIQYANNLYSMAEAEYSHAEKLLEIIKDKYESEPADKLDIRKDIWDFIYDHWILEEFAEARYWLACYK